MLKPLAVTLLLSAALATASFAYEEDPKTTDECFERAEALTEAAKTTQLSSDHEDEVEALLLRMELLCLEDNFLEAGAVAGDIQAVLEGR